MPVLTIWFSKGCPAVRKSTRSTGRLNGNIYITVWPGGSPSYRTKESGNPDMGEAGQQLAELLDIGMFG